MNQVQINKHVQLLSGAVLALRDGDYERFGELVDDSYRADVATGDGWRERLPLPRTMRVALLRARGELIAYDAMEAARAEMEALS